MTQSLLLVNAKHSIRVVEGRRNERNINPFLCPIKQIEMGNQKIILIFHFRMSKQYIRINFSNCNFPFNLRFQSTKIYICFTFPNTQLTSSFIFKDEPRLLLRP